MKLPAGWYPRDIKGIDGYLGESLAERTGSARAVAAPHAGWFFSAKIAAKALAALDVDAETVVIAGGHLPAGYPVLFAEEDAVSTPLGDMPIDGETRALVKREFDRAGIKYAEDAYADNTVEALLPAARRFFPRASLLWLRLGADIRAAEAGALIARAAASLNRRAVLIGSTDLTHYGPDYGFCPKGLGEQAVEWVKTVNDRRFIEAVVSGDARAVIERANNEHSACSAGAVLCALSFSRQLAAASDGTKPAAKLLAYNTSADALKDSFYGGGSFVGYAALEMC
jgi:AmmeMemoRadiSam system protein B